MNWRGRWIRLGWALCFALPGCSPGAGRIEPPKIDPVAAARKAIELYDANHDGVLTAEELDQCPGLKAAMIRGDAHDSMRVTVDAIAARLQEYRASRIALTSVTCRVTLDHVPLANATVRFVPESFLGSALKPAMGITNQDGFTVLSHEGSTLPGVHLGFYRVEISRQANGTETIPERYNVQTTLGQEVGPTVPGEQGARFALVGH
jgi:hypothetical protein